LIIAAAAALVLIVGIVLIVNLGGGNSNEPSGDGYTPAEPTVVQPTNPSDSDGDDQPAEPAPEIKEVIELDGKQPQAGAVRVERLTLADGTPVTISYEYLLDPQLALVISVDAVDLDGGGYLDEGIEL